MKEEQELISQAKAELSEPAKSSIGKFTDRVILNKLD